MGVNSLPKTVTRQRRGCDLNPGLSAPESMQHANHSATEPPCEAQKNLTETRRQSEHRMGVRAAAVGDLAISRKSDEICDETRQLAISRATTRPSRRIVAERVSMATQLAGCTAS